MQPETTNQAQPVQLSTQEIHSKKILAGILAIILPGIPIHKFILGYTKTAIIQLILTLITCGFFSILAFIEGIIYLATSDEDFAQKYIYNKHEWL